MAQGLQCWNANANLFFDTTTMTGRLLGTRVIASGASNTSQTITASLSAGKRLWWYIHVQGNVEANVAPGANSTNFVVSVKGGGSGRAFLVWGEY